ncbi:unnamed protein product [Pneumocystis jirovecii]|uniref:Uncharacterized protein n=1 Tax=Pneumocystis jirovecii TaxID=42068 RepID=L0PC07_PNEJI|nr:unnamed protein product [Pneumocystis jirovecii]CCJ29896.1 unnamed protein product [Pneumocystis jirovecii]
MQTKSPEYGIYTRVYAQEKTGQFRGGHKTSQSVQQPLQRVREDISEKRRTYSGYMRGNDEYSWEQSTRNGQRSPQLKERDSRVKEHEKDLKLGVYASPDCHMKNSEAQRSLSQRTISFGEGAGWKAKISEEEFRASEEQFRSYKRPGRSSRTCIKTYMDSQYELDGKSPSNHVDSKIDKSSICEESRDKPGLSRSLKVRRQHRMSFQHTEDGICIKSQNARMGMEKQQPVVGKNRMLGEKEEYLLKKKRDSREENKYFCEEKFFCIEKEQSWKEKPFCDKKIDFHENNEFSKEKARSPDKNTRPSEDMDFFDKNKNICAENAEIHDQKSVDGDLEVKEDNQDQKLTTILSIVKEMSKTNTADLSLNTLQDQVSKISGPSLVSPEKQSKSSRTSPFSMSSLSQRKKGGRFKDLEKEFFEKNASNKGTLFRRSIFGSYVVEDTFEDIRSSLKDIIQHSKSFNKELEDVPRPCLDRFSKNNTGNETFIKSFIGGKNSYIKDFVKRPLSVYDSFKFNNPLCISKDDQINSASDKSSDHRVSLQETSNINNSIDSKSEVKSQERQTMHRKLASLVSLKFLKDADDEKPVLSKGKIMKNSQRHTCLTKRVINDENLRPEDKTLSDTANANYSRNDSKVNENCNTNNLNFNNPDKQAVSESSFKNSYDNSHHIHSDDATNSDKCSVQTNNFVRNHESDYDSNKIEHKTQDLSYLSTNLEPTHSSTSQSVPQLMPQSMHTSLLEDDLDVNTFSFSKFGNVSFDTVKKTIASLKKK